MGGEERDTSKISDCLVMVNILLVCLFTGPKIWPLLQISVSS